MVGRYSSRQRIFIGYSPELADAEPVFAADDLSEIECKTLVAAVQRLFDDLHRSSGGGPWTLELGPSVQDDPVAFIDCKAKWQAHQRSFDEYRAAHCGHWRSEIVWLHDICAERADVIRALREHAIPTVYLQRDCGGGFQTFGRVDSLTWNEVETLESVLKNELYDMGMIFRLVTDLDAEESPEMFVHAKLGWNAIARELEVDEDAERDDAWWVAAEVIGELLSIRSKPRRSKSTAASEPSKSIEAEDEGGSVKSGPAIPEGPAEKPLTEPCDAEMARYRDPDNYWRNVWLYEQRKAGKTNRELLSELERIASERGFAPLSTDGGLRRALETIAQHHGWPVLEGRSGRPRAKSPPNGSDGDAGGDGES